MAAAPTSSSCPFCQSRSVQFIETQGLYGTLNVFRCDGCGKGWIEVSSTRRSSREVPAYSPPGKPVE